MKTLRATLIAKIPEERYRSFDGSSPDINDVITLDQGFTFPDGEPGCLVYSIDRYGKYKYEAEVYESEISDNNVT